MQSIDSSIILPDCQRRCFSTGSPIPEFVQVEPLHIQSHLWPHDDLRYKAQYITLRNLAVSLFSLLAIVGVYCRTVWLLAWTLTQDWVLRLVTHQLGAPRGDQTFLLSWMGRFGIQIQAILGYGSSHWKPGPNLGSLWPGSDSVYFKFASSLHKVTCKPAELFPVMHNTWWGPGVRFCSCHSVIVRCW